ncbi:hypothetical protein Bbelb_044610 [Branchiostoma belcheri]|nr:hypothetical protein Bbelb_044610 [Branchiostoma belcheri]
MLKTPRCATDPLPKLPEEHQDSICSSPVTQPRVETTEQQDILLSTSSYEDVDRNVPEAHHGKSGSTKRASRDKDNSGRVKAEFQRRSLGTRDEAEETMDPRSPRDPLPMPPDDACTANLFLATQPRVKPREDQETTPTITYEDIAENSVGEHHGEAESTEDTSQYISPDSSPGYHYYTGMDQAYVDVQQDGQPPPQAQCMLKLSPILGYVLAFCAGVAAAAVVAVILNAAIADHQGPQHHQGTNILSPATDLDMAPADSPLVTMGTTVTMTAVTTHPVKTALMMLPAATTGDEERVAEPLSIMSCASLRPQPGPLQSGVYTINIAGQNVQVYCDMDTAEGGWTVIQRRMDGSVDFNRQWEDYRDGFGHLSGEFWLGLEHVHQLTRQGGWKLRIDLERRESFSVGSESTNYQLSLSGFTGTAGNSMDSKSYPWTTARYMMFSTPDRDNDESLRKNCALEGEGGWWYNDCSLSGLNQRHPVWPAPLERLPLAG